MTQDQMILNQKLSSQRTETVSEPLSHLATPYTAPCTAPYLALSLALALSISALSGCESDSESAPDEPAVEGAGEASGEPAGEASGEGAGEASGEPAGEASGEPAGEESGEPAGEMAGMMEQPPLPPEYPVIQRLRAYINRQDGGLGIEAIGRDEDSDVIGFTLQYFFDDGEPLALTETGEPIALYFSDLRQGNGEYLGVWSIPLLIENSDLVRLAEVSVTVIDSEEHASYPKRIALLDTPTVPDGDQCDLNRGLSRCDEGSLCGTAAGGRTACGEAILECPDYYDVFDLNAQEGWRYEGDTSRDENGDPRPTYGVGSCGGGTRSMLFSFTAETDGRYSVVAQPTGNAPDFQGNEDTLMWIRSHCDFSDWNAELGCNDDINRAAGDLGSRIDLDLTSGQTIYIFVDGYSDPEQQIVGWSGPFTIEVSAL